MKEDQENEENAQLIIDLCDFISDKFLREIDPHGGDTSSQNKYAREVGLASSTISKIKSTKQKYLIPFETIYKICHYEGFPLSRFFLEFEDKYPNHFKKK